MMQFEGKVVVVTGGGSGIGKAAALCFARQGARVAICGRTQEKLADTVKEARGLPGKLHAIEADISQKVDAQRLFREVDEKWGRLDVCYAHAGVNGVWAPIEELEPEEWQKTLTINLTGTFHTVKYAVPLLKRDLAGEGGQLKTGARRGQKSITITSSINGTSKFSDLGSSAYSASKAGQIAFMKLLALELAPAGIRVNAVCPGSIATSVEEHMERRNTEAEKEMADYEYGGIPLTHGDAGEAEQVADLVAFLASEHASHITGATVTIDGGQSLMQ